MTEDETREVLGRSLAESGVGSTPVDEDAVRRRVRHRRRRRAATTAVAGVASVALVAVGVWQAGLLDPAPVPPVSPSETASTEEPSPHPSTDAGEAPSAGLDGTAGTAQPWTADLFPACGEPFTLPDRTHVLDVTGAPAMPVAPDGSWVVEVTNPGSEQLDGTTDGPVAVVVSDGVVVSTPETFGLPQGEAAPVLAIAPGASVRMAVPVGVRDDCDGAELAPGDYEVYVLVPLVSSDDNGSVPMGAGGPWPLTIATDGMVQEVEGVVPTGAVPFVESCGEAVGGESPSTGVTIELIDAIRSPRDATDDILGRHRLGGLGALDGVVLLDHVLVLEDGVQVSQELGGSDDVLRMFASEGADVELSFASPLLGCDGQPLPPGDYEVVVLQLMIGGGGGPQVVAVTAAAPMSLL